MGSGRFPILSSADHHSQKDHRVLLIIHSVTIFTESSEATLGIDSSSSTSLFFLFCSFSPASASSTFRHSNSTEREETFPSSSTQHLFLGSKPVSWPSSGSSQGCSSLAYYHYDCSPILSRLSSCPSQRFCRRLHFTLVSHSLTSDLCSMTNS